MTTPARHLTIDTLAERWGCSASHVRNIIAGGKLPALRLGKLIRIREIDVVEQVVRLRPEDQPAPLRDREALH